MADIPPVRYVRTADGVSIAYMAWPGEGIPFLRIRNLSAMPMALSTTIEDVRRFGGDRPMVWFDWRGAGQSARQSPVSMDDLLLDIDAVMSVIESDVVDVLAPQLACFTACTYAVTRGARWRSLVLVDPELRFGGSIRDLIWRPGWETNYESYLAIMLRQLNRPTTNEDTDRIARLWAETLPIDTMRAFQSIEERVDLTDKLGALDMPVLVLKVAHGSRADSVAALIPDSILLERQSGFFSRRLRRHWDEYIGAKFSDPPPAAPTPIAGDQPDLTLRQQEVLSLIAAGRSNREIAEQLTLSQRTVERHVENIFDRIGVNNRAEAVRWALEHGVG